MKKKLCASALALVLLTMLILPSHAAAGGKLHYILETGAADVAVDGTFTVTVKIRAEGGYQPSALRFYLLYDNTRFALEPGEEVRHGLVDDEPNSMFDLRDTVGEVDRYPDGMDETAREDYNVVVMQWCSLPVSAALPRIDASAATPVITLTFRALAALTFPDPGGRFILSADYGFGNTPYFEDVPVDVSLADAYVHPIGPDPAIAVNPGQDVVIAEGYILGLDPAMTLTGGVKQWDNSLLDEYFTVTNGIARVDNSAKPVNKDMVGTGSKITLYNPWGTRAYESYTMIVFGDLDGNFLVDLDDYAKARTLTLNTPVGDDVAYIAADVAAPYGVFDAADLAAIYAAAVGTGTIAQRGSLE